MKRISQLRQLSSDHHQALVIARRAKRAAEGGDLRQIEMLRDEIVELFHSELEPHFQIEECYLAQSLQDKGELQVVEQLLAEHKQLRDLVAGAADHPAEFLARFAGQLERHVRFEERELFEAAQACLDQATLERLESACRDASG